MRLTSDPKPRVTAEQIDQALRRLKASAAFKVKEKELDFVAVCLIGTEYPVPVRVGDNSTRWPVRVVLSRDPESAAKRPDLEQPLHELTVLEHIWVKSEAHAKRLKAALDTALVGRDAAMTTLRHAWRDCPDPSISWALLLAEAINTLRYGGQSIEVMTEQMRVQYVLNETRKAGR